MTRKLYLNTFEAAIGTQAAQITPTRWRRLASRTNQSMLPFGGVEVWFAWPRGASDKNALQAAKEYAELWDLKGRPSTGDLRKAIEAGDGSGSFNWP